MLDYIADLVAQEKAYVASTELGSISGVSEHDYIYIKNPSTSNTRLLITHVTLGTDSNSTRSVFKIYANPTVSADGSSLVANNTYIKSAPRSAQALVFKDPTVTSRGTYQNTTIVPADSGSRGLNRWYWIDPDNSMLVTVKNSVSNASSFIEVIWVEEI